MVSTSKAPNLPPPRARSDFSAQLLSLEPRLRRWVALSLLLALALALAALGGWESRLGARRLAADAAAMDQAHLYLLQCQQLVGAFSWAEQIGSTISRNQPPWAARQFNHAAASVNTLGGALQSSAPVPERHELGRALSHMHAALAGLQAVMSGPMPAALRPSTEAAVQANADNAFDQMNKVEAGAIERLASVALLVRAEQARLDSRVAMADDGAALLALLALVYLAFDFQSRRRAAALRRSALDDFRIGTYRRTPDGRLLFYNRAFAELLGLNPGAPRPVSLLEFAADEAARAYFVAPQPGASVEVALRRRDGTPAWALASARVVRGADIEGVLLDVTDRRRLQDRLRQAEKLEALGQLSGGVAHDFNNLLTVISGHCELLLHLGSLAPEVCAKLERIQSAAATAAAITRQLLVFSRRQPVAIAVLDLNHSLAVGEGLINALLGDRIEISVQPSSQPSWVRLDATQLQQILMNLAVNARDAMENGGRLAFAVQQRRVLPGSGHPVPSGDYVLLTVTDSGPGMDEATCARIFEPFFTTKALGTGLGLSTVHSIVTEAGGYIFVNSQPGRGTAFEIYFPAAEPQPAGPFAPAAAAPRA